MPAWMCIAMVRRDADRMYGAGSEPRFRRSLTARRKLPHTIDAVQTVRTSELTFRLGIGLIVGAGVGIVGWEIAPPHGAWAGLLPLLLTAIIALREPVRRIRTTRESFPDAWRDWLERHVPFYTDLPETHRSQFERDVQIFLAEHHFEGVSGVEVDDRLRLAVAAGAAILLHGRPTWELPGTHTFLFYPADFNEEYFLEEEASDVSLQGRAHGQGPVIFSVPAIEYDFLHPRDGENVILHELAHLIDFESAEADGLPSWLDASSADAWWELLQSETGKIRSGRSLLRPYAASHPTEFFAVATEVFFEQSRQMRRDHPELYEAMTEIYAQTPPPRIE